MTTLIRNRAFTGAISILAISTAMWFGGTSTALAHSGLENSSPTDGAVISEAPASIILTFNEQLLDDADSISLNAADGTNVVSTRVKPDGSTVELPWPADLPAGEYQVAYRVVSADGHPVTGAISFTYAPAADAATPSASSAPASPAASAETSESAVPISETTEPESTGGNPWLGLGIGVLIGLVLVVLFAAMRRRRS